MARSLDSDIEQPRRHSLPLIGANAESAPVPPSSALAAEVYALYEQLDEEMRAAGPRCEASGRCCRFKEYGHTLFLSNLEARVLLDGAPHYDSQSVSADFCPFQQGNLCTAREPRPLGCRVYFCDPNYQETGNALSERYLRRLKELADRHGLPWLYAPLHRFLADPRLAEWPDASQNES